MLCKVCGKDDVALKNWKIHRGTLHCPSCDDIKQIVFTHINVEGVSKTQEVYRVSKARELATECLGLTPLLDSGKAIEPEKGEIVANVRLRFLFPDGLVADYEDEELELSAEIYDEVLKDSGENVLDMADSNGCAVLAFVDSEQNPDNGILGEGQLQQQEE